MNRTEKNQDVAELSSCSGCGNPENPPGNRFCGLCGASLERSLARSRELAPRAREGRVTLKERFLPSRLGPVGKTVAVGLATIAADVGLAWLRHRLQKTDRPALSHDVDRAWREGPRGSGSEYLHSYSLKEAALMFREGGATRSWFSSELTIRSSRVEK